MVLKGYFSHTSPEGLSPWHWLTEVGYQFESAGENLAVNFYDSKIVHDAWMNSPAHRENILKGKYTEIGIGMAWGQHKGREALFVVQFFGKPAEASEIVVATIDTSEGSTNITNEEARDAQTQIIPNTERVDDLVVLSESDEFIEVAVEEPAEVALPQNLEREVLGEEVVREAPSPISKAASMPVTTTVMLLWVVALVSACALILKIFIRRDIQYGTLIMNGAAIIAISVLLILGNYYLGTFETMVL